jgi:4-carboxymuconolactone decarboxylase
LPRLAAANAVKRLSPLTIGNIMMSADFCSQPRIGASGYLDHIPVRGMPWVTGNPTMADKPIKTDQQRYDAGMAVRRSVLGDAWVDKAKAKLSDFNGPFQDLITRYAWGEIWTRPGLDRKTRSCMVLSTMIALGAWDEYRLHVRAAFNNGLTKDDILEVILQAAIYAGVPKANHAVKEAEAVFAELGR